MVELMFTFRYSKFYATDFSFLSLLLLFILVLHTQRGLIDVSFFVLHIHTTVTEEMMMYNVSSYAQDM